MRFYGNLLDTALPLLLLLFHTACGLKPAKSYYRRSYYSSAAPPSVVRFAHKSSPSTPLHIFGPREDLQTNASKRREVSKKYSKKTHYRPYASEEDERPYSGERFNSAEYSSEQQDSREYTIGTQIRVQHPITVPKKPSSTYSTYNKHTKFVTPVPPYKGLSDISNEEQTIELPKRSKYTDVRYEPSDPFHLVPPPKALATSSSNSYSVFESDNDDYEAAPTTRSKTYDRYKSVASKKQIEAFLEDQQKLLDEAIKLQLLNNPKLQKFLKSKVNEEQRQRPDLDLDDFESYPPNFSGSLRHSYSNEHEPHHGPPPPPSKSTRSRRRPPGGFDFKHSPKTKHIIKPKRKYRSTALVINV